MTYINILHMGNLTGITTSFIINNNQEALSNKTRNETKFHNKIVSFHKFHCNLFTHNNIEHALQYNLYHMPFIIQHSADHTGMLKWFNYPMLYIELKYFHINFLPGLCDALI